MNVRDTLIDALKSLNYDVRLQGSYADNDPLPESFITYSIPDSQDDRFYDNEPKTTHTYINLIFYSKKMSLINTVPNQIYIKLKQAGFIRSGNGQDYSYENEHYGWLMNYIYTERN